MRRPYLFWFSLLGLILVFFLDTDALKFKHADFVFDDLPVIVLNPQLHSPSFIEAMSFNPFRATVYATYWAQIRLKHGGSLEPGAAGGFRLVNVILHWAAGMVLAWLCIRLFPARKYPPLVCAYLFWLNPLFLEAQNLVLGRTEIMATIFYLLALGFYLGPKRSLLSRLGFFAALILALFSKETTVTLPVAALLLSLYKSERPKWLEIIGGSTLVIVYMALRLSWTIELAKSSQAVPAWPSYFLDQNWILWFGAFKTLIPVHLNFDYALGNHFLLGIIFLVLNLAIFSAVLVKSLRGWKTGWLILIWPVLYLPLMAIPLADSFRESRLYLSSAWLIMLVSFAFSTAIPKRKITAWAALAAVLICFGLLGFARAQVWASGESLWQDAVTQSPKKFRPVFNYANAQRRMLELKRAKSAYLWAKSLQPENLEVNRNLYLIEEAEKNPEALKRIKQALEAPPETP